MMKRNVLFALGLAMTAALSAQTPKNIEYFLDTDPGYGKATVFSNIHIGDNALTFDVSTAEEGAHVLYVRAQDSEGRWSATLARPLFIERLQDIVYVEYFFDTDPGIGNGTAIPLPNQEYKAHLELLKELDVDHLSLGEHELFVRALDRFGQWSNVMSRRFNIIQKAGPVNPPVVGDLSRIEYFFDTDPGYGLGRQLENPHTGANTYIMDFSGLEAGAHVLYLRAEDTKSNWSATLARPFFVMNPAPSSITAIEYYIDADPGNGFGIPVPLPSSFENDIAFEVQTNEISVGNHQFSVRICDETGKWSVVKSQPFQVVTEDGVLSVKWLMNVAVQAKEGTVVLTDASSSRNEDCVVELFSLSGQSLGAHDWPLDQNHLTIPVAAHHRMLVVKVTERKSQLQVVQRLMMQ